MSRLFAHLALFAILPMLAHSVAHAQQGKPQTATHSANQTSTQTTPQTTPQTITHASQVAQAWLVDVDGDQYGKSWDKAASLFQDQISKTQWEVQMIRVRGLLGSVTQRKLISANLRQQLPGMPDGNYVVLLYQTTFEHKAKGSETITPMLDKDGKWKVTGYLIR